MPPSAWTESGAGPRNGSRSFAATSTRRSTAADPLDPGVPVPAAEWARAVVPHLGLELRGAKLYRPGVGPELGERTAAAEALTAQLGVEPVRVEDARLARFLEEQGRLVRVGDGFAISPAAYEEARAACS